MDRGQLHHDIEQYRSSASNMSLDRKPRDVLKSKLTFRIPLTEEQALMARERDRSTVGADYTRRENDLQNHLVDWKRESGDENLWRQKENEFELALMQFRAAVRAREQNRATNDDLRVITELQSEERVKSWIKGARDVRKSHCKAKEEHWNAKVKLDKEMKNLVENQGSNYLSRDANGHAIKVYSSAPGYIVQPSGRGEMEVARELVQMLCNSEGLKGLEYGKTVQCLKDYRECFPEGEEMNIILRNLMDHLERNKAHLTREKLAESCYVVLNLENQLKHVRAMDVVKGADSKDMSELAVYYLRNKRRKDSMEYMRSTVREGRLRKEYKKYSRRSYGERDRRNNGRTRNTRFNRSNGRRSRDVRSNGGRQRGARYNRQNGNNNNNSNNNRRRNNGRNNDRNNGQNSGQNRRNNNNRNQDRPVTDNRPRRNDNNNRDEDNAN